MPDRSGLPYFSGGFMLTLLILSPGGIKADVSCDSVVLTVRDSSENGKGGGSYGIRKGHAEAIIATANGNITAKKDGNVIFSDTLSEGTATVSKDKITVITY